MASPGLLPCCFPSALTVCGDTFVVSSPGRGEWGPPFPEHRGLKGRAAQPPRALGCLQDSAAGGSVHANSSPMLPRPPTCPWGQPRGPRPFSLECAQVGHLGPSGDLQGQEQIPLPQPNAPSRLPCAWTCLRSAQRPPRQEEEGQGERSPRSGPAQWECLSPSTSGARGLWPPASPSPRCL